MLQGVLIAILFCPVKVHHFVLTGWPTQINWEEEYRPYFQKQFELSAHQGCLLLGNRVIVPPCVPSKVMEVLHSTHSGVSRMKALARSYIWWPQMDAEIERAVKNCARCQECQKSPAKAPLHLWEWPKCAWFRVHADYAGPIDGMSFLVLVDAYSKWLEVLPVKSPTTRSTVEALRTVFATHGLPEMLVTDFGTAFTSREFKDFTSRDTIRHVTTSPYHPSSNGLAERAAQPFKKAFKKLAPDSVNRKLAQFFLQYRLTPQEPHPSSC